MPIAAAPPSVAYTGTGNLVRPRVGRKLAGVFAAFARAYGWDVAIVRIVAVILGVIALPLSEFAYFVAWILIPEEQVAPYIPPYYAAAPEPVAPAQAVPTVAENSGAVVIEGQ